MKHKMTTLERIKIKDEMLIKQYLSAITWERIFFIWKDTLESFGVDKDNIFLEIKTNNSKLNCGVLYFSWWKRNKIVESKKSLLKVIENTQPLILNKKPFFDQGFKSAELKTLKKLWEFKNDSEKTAALLLRASLFTRIDSGKASFPQGFWPPSIVIEKLSEMIAQILGGSCNNPIWHHSCAEVIPTFSKDFYFKIENITALIHYLAVEHCKLLCKYQPVRISNVTS